MDLDALRIKPGRAGRCYELAYRYVVDEAHDGALLVHGQIRSTRADLDRIEHAWVYLPPGCPPAYPHYSPRVYDPVLDVVLWADAYYPWAEATEHARWTRAEARSEALDRKHYGPWAGPQELR